MIKNLRKNKKGFTLVEIIVVLVIMGILLALAVPAVLGYISKAQDQQYIAEARNGFLGANTIVATENARGVATGRSQLKAADINKEIGETDLITAMSCTVEQDSTIDTKYNLKSCAITVKSKDDRTYTFTANKEVVGSDGATTDTETTYPTTTTPKS
ncbi:MAG: type II secretion system protein [Longicatena sp.]